LCYRFFNSLLVNGSFVAAPNVTGLTMRGYSRSRLMGPGPATAI